jgi:urea transport system permease protein
MRPLPPDSGKKNLMIRRVLASLGLLLSLLPVVFGALPQTVAAQSALSATSMQDILQEHAAIITKSSRKTIGPAIGAVANSGLAQAQSVLEAWQAKDIWQRQSDGLFFRAQKTDAGYDLYDFDQQQVVATAQKGDLKQIKPNSGIRALLAVALVQFQLSDPDPERRAEALLSLERDPSAEALAPLRAAIPTEDDPDLLAKKQRLERLLTIAYGSSDGARIQAINDMAGDLGVDVRATLNPVLATTREVYAAAIPDGVNVARPLSPGDDTLPRDEAYEMLVAQDLAPARVSSDDIRTTLAAHIEGGYVGGVALAQLSDPERRIAAYETLVAAAKAPALVSEPEVTEALAAHRFADVYAEPSTAVTDAARAALRRIETKVQLNQTLDLGLDALSLGSIYFLAAIGLAITFGVMGVINMAHGEFIMMGAYTGYVVQQVIPDHTLSIAVAIPLAFGVTFLAGVALERLVIRWLYNRPLETLLATFGVSIALQQLAKNIFGTQARPLTAPDWLGGAWVLNDVVSISYIRIAIFVLALLFLGLFLFVMKRTRLGLETRAVTQNPGMAASMGINTDRVNMLTFGLGSGIAGIAGVAIGLFAKVTSELGQDYIVQSFMTVVVGGVGNIWGTLLGAGLIGGLQKSIEWLNPSNTLAAQTYMIIFIIIFIQFRPRGIIALKGRAAGD